MRESASVEMLFVSKGLCVKVFLCVKASLCQRVCLSEGLCVKCVLCKRLCLRKAFVCAYMWACLFVCVFESEWFCICTYVCACV